MGTRIAGHVGASKGRLVVEQVTDPEADVVVVVRSGMGSAQRDDLLRKMADRLREVGA